MEIFVYQKQQAKSPGHGMGFAQSTLLIAKRFQESPGHTRSHNEEIGGKIQIRIKPHGRKPVFSHALPYRQ